MHLHFWYLHFCSQLIVYCWFRRICCTIVANYLLSAVSASSQELFSSKILKFAKKSSRLFFRRFERFKRSIATELGASDWQITKEEKNISSTVLMKNLLLTLSLCTTFSLPLNCMFILRYQRDGELALRPNESSFRLWMKSIESSFSLFSFSHVCLIFFSDEIESKT